MKNCLMKKVLCIVLAMLMLAGHACAENVQTRERTILVEGCEEIITETLYESPKGFRIWYPADIFSVKFEDDFDQFDSIVEGVDMGISIIDAEMSYEEADALLDALIEQSLANNGTIPVGIEEWDLESGIHAKYVDIVYEDTHNPSCYLYGNDRVFSISFHYPAGAAEGFGSRIMQAISTFELVEWNLVSCNGSHNWGDWVWIDDATHSRVCVDCLELEDGSHNWGDWVWIDDATHSRVCVDCLELEDGSHNWGDWVWIDDATHSRVCVDCLELEDGSHNWGDWVWIDDATHSRVCVDCLELEDGSHSGGASASTEDGLCADCN